MLDKSSLSQLKQLKKEIKDSKEYAVGIVKGTQRKFGFVVVDDGREIYLAPDQMEKVLPGDKVKLLIITEPNKQNNQNKQNKEAKPKVSGQLEKLLDSPLKEFTGRYIVRGQGHFVEPDLPNLSRWIFIPPQARNNASPGDFIRCKISRHPYPSAKPQARILQVIGSPDTVGIEADYIVNKFQLAPNWPKDWQQSLTEIDESQREDLTGTSFITIDAPSTQDMDDAIYASVTETGWELQVAIADPSALIAAGSELDKIAAQRANSAYLPGQAVPMLPPELANDRCSLAPGEKRPSLVCQMQIDKSGNISHYQMKEAIICSRAKLSYSDVAQLLEGTASDDNPCQAYADVLGVLKDLSTALLDYRREHCLVIPNRQDYRMLLNERRRLERIEPQTKTSAHQLIEECMVAANRCSANMLGEQGLFIVHPGFRSERMADVRKLAEEQLGLTDVDFSTPEGYRQLMKAIDDEALDFPLRPVLSRLLERSRFSTTAQPHYGMGLAAYTTFTSPIRKFSDLLIHRIIKAKLHQEQKPQQEQNAQQPSIPAIEQDAVQALQQAQDNARQAKSQLEQWLKCQYMEERVGQTFEGTVSQINSNGFTVRINDLLVEGFVETRQLPEKYSFDPMRLKLTSKSRTIQLEQAISIVVQEVDCNRRSIRYTLPAAPKEENKETSEVAEEQTPG